MTTNPVREATSDTTETERIMYAGEAMTVTTGQRQETYTLSLPGGEIARLREALRKVRPKHHEHLCDNGPDGPDTWVDQTEEDVFCREHMRAVKWVAGVGFVDDPDRPETPPYVGWCCRAATQRHIIDEALGAEVSAPPA